MAGEGIGVVAEGAASIGVVCTVVFVHPLRASQSEGEGACLIGLPDGGRFLCWLVGLGVAPSLGRLGRLLPLHTLTLALSQRERGP